jgi:DNA-binding protein H-NS
MAELCITLVDLEPRKKQPRTKAPVVKFKATSGVSYRDPASGVLWSGRGRRPAWVIRWMTEGQDSAALAVPAA